MTNTIRLQGVEGGLSDEKDGVSYLSIGIMTGNLWEHAVHEYNRYGRVEGLAVQAFSFHMTTNLAELMLQCPYTLVDDGLHVDIDLGEHSEEEIHEIMTMNKRIQTLERNLNEQSLDSQEIRLMMAERKSLEYRKIIEELVNLSNSSTLLPHQKVEQYEFIIDEAKFTLEA